MTHPGMGGANVGAAIVIGMCLIAVFADAIAPGDPFATSDAALLSPSARYPFGSDDIGRDLFCAVVHGTRASLLVGAGTAAAAATVGVLVGASAGFAGGLTDDLLMRATELFQAMPRFFLVLAVAAVLGSRLGTLILVLGFTSWTSVARMTRAQVSTVRTSDHVVAARAAGASVLRVVVQHVLPSILAPLVALASFQASGAMLVEAGVSFLGLGDPSVITWGALLHDAQRFLRVAWWMALFPGAALTITVLGIQLIGDAVSDAIAGATTDI